MRLAREMLRNELRFVFYFVERIAKYRTQNRSVAKLVRKKFTWTLTVKPNRERERRGRRRRSHGEKNAKQYWKANINQLLRRCYAHMHRPHRTIAHTIKLIPVRHSLRQAATHSRRSKHRLFSGKTKWPHSCIDYELFQLKDENREKRHRIAHTQALAVRARTLSQMHLHSSESNRPLDRFKLTSRCNHVPFGVSGCVKICPKIDETRIVEHVLAAERIDRNLTSHIFFSHDSLATRATWSSVLVRVSVWVWNTLPLRMWRFSSLSLRPSFCDRISFFPIKLNSARALAVVRKAETLCSKFTLELQMRVSRAKSVAYARP